MAYVYQRWLAAEFRAAGLTVREVAGWKNRGRPASTGGFAPRANTVHHTGATTSTANPTAGLSVLIGGRAGLPGPLCHYAIDYLGRVWVVAAGRANHAGRVGRSGVPGMALGDGNSQAIGNEVMTNGTQPLPAAQKRAIAVTSAVVMDHFNRNAQWTHRHQDISTTGKWDIGQLTTPQLRRLVADALDNQGDDMPAPRDWTEKDWEVFRNQVGNGVWRDYTIPATGSPAQKVLRQASNSLQVSKRVRDIVRKRFNASDDQLDALMDELVALAQDEDE